MTRKRRGSFKSRKGKGKFVEKEEQSDVIIGVIVGGDESLIIEPVINVGEGDDIGDSEGVKSRLPVAGSATKSRGARNQSQD